MLAPPISLCHMHARWCPSLSDAQERQKIHVCVCEPEQVDDEAGVLPEDVVGQAAVGAEISVMTAVGAAHRFDLRGRGKAWRPEGRVTVGEGAGAGADIPFL
jgi:hypothetical protein